MRVVHLSTYDTAGGAALAAHRLHLRLVESGVESTMLVRRRHGAAGGVLEPQGYVAKVGVRLKRRLEIWRARRGGWNGMGRFTPGVSGRPLRAEIEALKPDIVHLHWISDGFFDVAELGRLGRPVVWTMHDMWAFTGGCHYAGECRRYCAQCGCCPLLGARTEADLSRRMWERKRRAYAGVRLTAVAPSRWMAEAARGSSLWGGRKVVTIPNGIDTACFTPGDRTAARTALGLPIGGSLVLAGATEFQRDRRKGFDLFAAVAARLNELAPGRYRFATFGTAPAGRYPMGGVECLELGPIGDPCRLAAAYAAADVFVAPSREDNLPNTLVESLACGTPVASFAVGGIPDIVADGVNGCLAAPLDAAGLAVKIHALVGDSVVHAAAGVEARRKAEETFSIPGMVGSYTELYRRVLSSP